MAKIYAVANVPPEVSAYGMAKYSRSSSPLCDTLKEISQERAANFLDTFYFSYGHASIADLAHIVLAIEDISLLAAMTVVDEPLWDGQERSTRYQNFVQAPYYRPVGAPAEFDQSCGQLFDFYGELLQASLEALQDRYPRPEHMAHGTYQRTMQARALDIARYALPLATLTSVGQVTSARVLEQQISRLLTSEYAEIRDAAQEMKLAVTERPAFSLTESQPQPLAPTLIKYANSNPYLTELTARSKTLATEIFCSPPPGREDTPVDLFMASDPITDGLAMAFYGVTTLPFGWIREVLRDLSAPMLAELVDDLFQRRDAYDEWPKFFRTGTFLFDILMDIGAFRDFNRHRRLNKVVQAIDIHQKFSEPEMLQKLAVPVDYPSRMDTYYQNLNRNVVAPFDKPYLLPLAHRRRALFVMDPAQAAYIIELRSRSAGHFSYRQIAVKMYHSLQQVYPALAQHIRVTPLDEFDPFER